MGITQGGIRPVDPLLSRVLAEGLGMSYLVDQGVLPVVNVGGPKEQNKTGTYIIDNPRPYNNVTGVDLKRSRNADRHELGVQDPDTGTFNIEIYADKVPIDLQYDPLVDQLGMLEQRRGAQAARVISLQAEKRLEGVLFNAANWTNIAASAIPGGGAVQWDDPASKPLTAINYVAREFHRQAYGERVNTVTIGYDTAIALNANEEIRGYAPNAFGTAGVGSRVMSAASDFAALKQVLGDFLGIPPGRIFIGSAVEDSANIGQPTATKTFVWEDNFWMGHVDLDRPMIANSGTTVSMGPTAAINFQAFGLRAGGYNEPGDIKRYVWAERANQYKAIRSNLGYLITDTNA